MDNEEKNHAGKKRIMKGRTAIAVAAAAAAAMTGIFCLTGEGGNAPSLVSRCSAVFTEAAEKMDRAETHLPGYDRLRNAGARIRRTYDGDMVPFVSSSHVGYPQTGYYEHLFSYPVSGQTIDHAAEELQSLNRYLEEKGIGLLYVQAANKICRYEKLPGGAQDYSNQNFDRLLEKLSEAGIDSIDTREIVHETRESSDDMEGDDPAAAPVTADQADSGTAEQAYSETEEHHAWFYKTDHHWKAEYGLTLAKDILKDSNARGWTKADLSLLDEDLYELRTFPGAMFGSDGESVGRGYAEPEDYRYLDPLFPTELAVTHHRDPDGADAGELLTGSFADTMVNTALLEACSGLSGGTGGYVYEQMLGGNRPLTTVANPAEPEGDQKDRDNYLLIMDSYGLCVAPYIALTGGQTWIVDRRPENGNYQGSIHELVEALHPSVVIVLSGNVPGDYDYR